MDESMEKEMQNGPCRVPYGLKCKGLNNENRVPGSIIL